MATSRSTLVLFAALAAAPAVFAVEVGSGAPSDSIRQSFIRAFYRGNFSSMVTNPPIADVRALGSTGLVQEFQDAARTTGVKLALVMPNPAAPSSDMDVLQIWGNVYSLFNSIGVNTAGYPVMDTANCPNAGCTYQFFTKNYGLFVYTQALAAGSEFAVRDPIYTKWTALGGVGNAGLPADIARTLTSKSGMTATQQVFTGSILYAITSGTLSGQVFAVKPPMLAIYQASGGPGGPLGLPVTDTVTSTTGLTRQSFEGGRIEMIAGQDPVLKLPVSAVSLTPQTSSIRMAVGEKARIEAGVFDSAGNRLDDRTVNWATTNGRVASIEGTGLSVMVKGAGAGSATITATSEGIRSSGVTVYVTAPCCDIGEGAPTPAVQQAFVDAVTRNRLSIKVPGPDPVRRTGAGYTQSLAGSGTAQGAEYLAGKADTSSMAWVVSGAILAAYKLAGGPGGDIGYPASDATAGGRQLFENSAALAGTPVRLVSGAVLTKWANLGYETGAAGPPAGDPLPFFSTAATRGTRQAFSGGTIFAALTGLRAGQGWWVKGPILACYDAAGGPGGTLGAPTSDEFVTSGVRRQAFEGGYVEVPAGEESAVAVPSERRPSVTILPGTVTAGGRVQLAFSGFPDGAAVKVSASGEPDFVVSTANGAHSWQAAIPAVAANRVVTVRAADTKSAGAAEGSYTIRALASARLKIAKLPGGDGQSGVPGGALSQPLRVQVTDESGVAAAGVTVVFTASPGAAITPASTMTDQAGSARAVLRLPAAEGVVLANAAAGTASVTFSAKADASTLPNFPGFGRSSGGMIAAVAGILRYHQNRGEMTTSGGLADPDVLENFLNTFCAVDSSGGQVCDGLLGTVAGERVVNLWRLGGLYGRFGADFRGEGRQRSGP